MSRTGVLVTAMVGLGVSLGGAVQAWAEPVKAGPGVERVQYRREYDDRRYDDRRSEDPRYEDRRSEDRPYDDRRSDRRGGGGAAPGGSYQRSCGQVEVRGSLLTAICRNGRGQAFETSIDLARCGRSDIGNDWGTLSCQGARGQARPVD